MKILIQIDYLGLGESEITQRGYFDVKEKEFAINSDKEASRVAYGFLQWIKREIGMDVKELQAVTYNGDSDITENIKELSNENSI
ncbi:hypothetical protein V4V35_25670 [Bacillus infantis]|uniref:hypothetical protein n=1 Tax=Bacillus infantis TaxID=324767 RepID=UPI002FBE3D25